MSALLVLFSENLLPIFLAAGAGYALSRFLSVNPRNLSQIIFYIFSPALIFNLITHSQLSDGDILRIMGFAAVINLLLGGITYLVGRLLKLERRMLAALLIVTMFMNAGNYGLSVNLFAFGEGALAFASLYFVTNSILVYTVGVIIASMGTASFKTALANLFKLPVIYALLLAFVFLRTGWSLPLPLERTTTLLGQAAIPGMLVLLGMQFKNMHWDGKSAPLALGSIMRLLVSPALAILVSLAFGLQGAARQAAILESAMPTAVIATVLATEYEVEPGFVTATVFVTTIFSAVTLTPLLAYLGG